MTTIFSKYTGHYVSYDEAGHVIEASTDTNSTHRKDNSADR